jgi:hypothetical protein
LLDSNSKVLPDTGHSRSPLEAHRQWLLDLVAAEPDLTLEEIRARLKSEKRPKTGTNSVWRFYNAMTSRSKKRHAAEQDRPDVAAARAELKVEQSGLTRGASSSSTRLRLPPRWSGIAAAHHVASVSLRACRTATGRR